MTSSSSPGSLLYAGSEVTDIWEGVRLALRFLRGRGNSVALSGPTSCSAVISLPVGLLPDDSPGLLIPTKPANALRQEFLDQANKTTRRSNTTIATIGI